MDTVRFIRQSLQQVQIRLLATCDGLTQEPVLWRPAPHANNIGFILWHVARAEDGTISRVSNQSTLWESQKWYEKFGQPMDSPDPGDVMGFQALPLPPLEVLISYIETTYQRAQEFLSTITSDDLDSVPDPSQPDRPMAASLRHLITHKNNHHGQIDFIRGLQQETWDLPMGTGVVLPCA